MFPDMPWTCADQVDDDVESLREDCACLTATLEKREVRILQLEETLAQVCLNLQLGTPMN